MTRISRSSSGPLSPSSPVPFPAPFEPSMMVSSRISAGSVRRSRCALRASSRTHGVRYPCRRKTDTANGRERTPRRSRPYPDWRSALRETGMAIGVVGRVDLEVAARDHRVMFGKDVFNRCVNFERHSRTQAVVVDTCHERPFVVRLGSRSINEAMVMTCGTSRPSARALEIAFAGNSRKNWSVRMRAIRSGPPRRVPGRCWERDSPRATG